MSTSVADKPKSTFGIAQFPCLSDNYGFLLHDPETGETAAIDVPCGRTYRSVLDERGWKLTQIFNTHHHNDHTGGNMELKGAYDGVTIHGPEAERIPGIDVKLNGGDDVEFGNGKFKAKVIDVGGHTKGHIAYYFPEQSCVFVGDSLFSLGCGRMFEGTPSQFWASLLRLRQLPPETTVYCAHEYTQANAKFAMSVEPNNSKLAQRVEIIKAKRSRGDSTVPVILSEELETNPFLRVDTSEEIRANIGVQNGDTDAQAFGKLRKAKDNF